MHCTKMESHRNLNKYLGRPTKTSQTHLCWRQMCLLNMLKMWNTFEVKQRVSKTLLWKVMSIRHTQWPILTLNDVLYNIFWYKYIKDKIWSMVESITQYIYSSSSTELKYISTWIFPFTLYVYILEGNTVLFTSPRLSNSYNWAH